MGVDDFTETFAGGIVCSVRTTLVRTADPTRLIGGTGGLLAGLGWHAAQGRWRAAFVRNHRLPHLPKEVGHPPALNP